MILNSSREKFHFMRGLFEERLKKYHSLKLNELRVICGELKGILDSGEEPLEV